MIINSLIQFIIELIMSFLSPFFAVVPLFDGFVNTPIIQDIFAIIGIALGFLSHIAGDPSIVIFPVALNTTLLVAELALSLVWWIIYKLPFLGIKK